MRSGAPSAYATVAVRRCCASIRTRRTAALAGRGEKKLPSLRADAKKCPRCFSTKLVVEKNAVVKKPNRNDEDEQERRRPPATRYAQSTRQGKPKNSKKGDEDEQPRDRVRGVQGVFVPLSRAATRRCGGCASRWSACLTAAKHTCSPPDTTACGKRITPTVAVVQPGAVARRPSGSAVHRPDSEYEAGGGATPFTTSEIRRTR